MARPKRKENPILPAIVAETPKERVYRVGGYARLSVEDSGRPGADTIETQAELIRSYIESQPDMQLHSLYCDNGKTGTNFERPEFERLMEDVRTGKIDCIVVKDLSRFGRNYLETGNYLERIFPFLGIRFVAVNDHFDTLTAERNADGYIVPLKNMINGAYSKDISRKVGAALATMMRNGDFIGDWGPYGYRRCADDPHRIEPEEETAPIVQDIFRWRLSGMNCGQIARRLNEMEIPSPGRYRYLRGERKAEWYDKVRWSHQTVKTILSNEVYLGHMVQGRTHSDISKGQKQHCLPKSEWVIVHNTHVPLIDGETFRAVQKMMEDSRNAFHARLGRYDDLGTTPNILRGLLFCADCKRPLTRVKSVTCKGTKRTYLYFCPSHSRDPASCPRKNIHETQVYEILWDTLRREIALAEDMEKLTRQYARSTKVTGQEAFLDREAAAAQQTLDRAEMLYDSLYQNYVDRLMTEREYREMKQRYREDMEQARARLDDVEKRRQTILQQTADNPWLTTFGQFQGETELTEEMAHALIERVEIDSDKHFSIVLRYRDEYRTLALILEGDGKVVSA